MKISGEVIYRRQAAFGNPVSQARWPAVKQNIKIPVRNGAFRGLPAPSPIFLQIFYMFLHVFEDNLRDSHYAVPVCNCVYPAMVERLGKFISLRVHTIAK